MERTVKLYRYIWVETDGKPNRILATDPISEPMSFEQYIAFQRELVGIVELAVVMDGRVECYL